MGFGIQRMINSCPNTLKNNYFHVQKLHQTTIIEDKTKKYSCPKGKVFRLEKIDFGIGLRKVNQSHNKLISP